MNSFKTIKIAVLSGLMLNLVMPVQAGFTESAKIYLEKAVTFSGNNPATSVLAFIFGASALGAGIGYAAAKRNTAAITDKAIIERIIHVLKIDMLVAENHNNQIKSLTNLRDGMTDKTIAQKAIDEHQLNMTKRLKIDNNIDQLTSLRQIDRDWIKEHISKYHDSFTKSYDEIKQAGDTLIEGLRGYVYELESRPEEWAYFGALAGMSIFLAAKLLKSAFNPKQ